MKVLLMFAFLSATIVKDIQPKPTNMIDPKKTIEKIEKYSKVFKEVIIEVDK